MNLKGVSDVQVVALGPGHSYILKKDGTVWSWGRNFRGGLADGTQTDRHTPIKVNGLLDVKALACGEAHNIALKTDGSVWAVGCNSNGQLGDGSQSDRYSFVQAKGISGELEHVTVQAGWQQCTHAQASS